MITSSTNTYRKILLGGASALAIATSSISASAQEGDQDQGEQSGIETIIVTATKRAVNVQDIPSSVQAITGEALQKMGAHNAEDFMRFIPAVSFVSSTPGSNNIVFRGINIGLGSYIGQAGASIYLDEMSLTSSGDQPDVRMVDIAGVEALSGPQGTLYGDSAQAGVLRITTNKPNMSETQAILDVGLRKGGKSDLSYDVSGIFNIPIVEDKFAIRIVAERAKDGGFIDNVLGNTPDHHAYYWYDNAVMAEQFPNWGTADNGAVAEDRWNGVDYLTARISAKINMNENWSATFSFAHQENETNADNGYNPFVGDLQTIDFNRGFREDKWSTYGLVLDGDLGWAQVVSSTSFYQRDIDNRYDTTTYSKYYSLWGCYSGDGAGGDAAYAAYCLGPETDSDVISHSSYPSSVRKFSQEVRFTGQVGNFDWLVGGYFEDTDDTWQGYFAAPSNYDYQDSISLAYWEDEYGETYPDAIAAWGSSDDTSWKQLAIFGESTWHMSDKIHLTVGARWFERTNSKFYKAYQPNTKLKGDFESGPASVANKGKDREFVPKVSLSYDINDDSMVYALYTKGFRPGGTNRSRGDLDRLVFPTVYSADELTNYEIGSKNRFFDNRLQLNMSYYYMKWKDFQLQVVDPSYYQSCDDFFPYCDQPWQSVVANSPGGAHTEGVEVDVVMAPSEGLTIGGNINWLSAKTDGAFEAANIGAGVDLPNVPKWKGSVFASYYWPVEFVSGGEMYVRGQYTYKGENKNRMFNGAEYGDTGLYANPIIINESYGIADITAGLIAHDDGWEFTIYAKNITDARAQYQHSTGTFDYQFSRTGQYDHYAKVYTNRPREFGMRMKWSY